MAIKSAISASFSFSLDGTRSRRGLGVAALLVHLRRTAVVALQHHEDHRDDQAEHSSYHENHADDLEIHVSGLPGHAEAENRADNDECGAGTDRHRKCHLLATSTVAAQPVERLARHG